MEEAGLEQDQVEKARTAEAPAYRMALEELRQAVPYTEAVVISSLPRGGLQITQPQTISETLLKSYGKDFHAEDRLTWEVIIQQKAMTLEQAWGSADNRYANEFLRPAGLKYAIAAPLTWPVLDGYPGAIHLYRSAALGDFTEKDLAKLEEAAAAVDRSVARIRSNRPTPDCNIVLRHDSPVRQFVFDGELQPRLGAGNFKALDAHLREGMLMDARQRLPHVAAGKATASDRVPLADSRGDLWNFRVIVFREYPALGTGPFIFYCQQPECKQWGALRATDFPADAEVARLVPALKYMQEHFSHGPTLVNISRTVHLSPFHFHRRFTELLGITPKHFLLDCQIEEAKRMLVARDRGLSEIATACGFAHQSHFTSRFKQATGLTPTRWRRLASESQKSSTN